MAQQPPHSFTSGINIKLALSAVNAIDPAIPSQTCERRFPINFPSANVGLGKIQNFGSGRRNMHNFFSLSIGLETIGSF
jgi:hypothetical protein